MYQNYLLLLWVGLEQPFNFSISQLKQCVNRMYSKYIGYTRQFIILLIYQYNFAKLQNSYHQEVRYLCNIIPYFLVQTPRQAFKRETQAIKIKYKMFSILAIFGKMGGRLSDKIQYLKEAVCICKCKQKLYLLLFLGFRTIIVIRIALDRLLPWLSDYLVYPIFCIFTMHLYQCINDIHCLAALYCTFFKIFFLIRTLF
eukprot:TRINITY_DN4235_c0_g1_i2.p2 TRINITY_DN4235_c0_g1~~TRINITY_DN4235_c0_g1_i2.p2  ORF type:complete len:199 (-),score=-18.69 TRINITY_DN4235_c0_g1_i2:227-823(-)